MTIVLDASAAVFTALHYSPGPLDDAESVFVPDLYSAEVANALWKEHAFAGLDASVCESALDGCLAYPNEFVPATALYREAFRLAIKWKHPVYDMFYIALALREVAPFYTRDKSLRKLARANGIETV